MVEVEVGRVKKGYSHSTISICLVNVGVYEQLTCQPKIMHSFKDGAKSLVAAPYVIE